VADTARQFGPVSLLINNAGTPGPVGSDWEVDAAAWWECIEVIVRGAFLCTQAVLPGMLARGGGRIIQMASVSGTRAFPAMTATSVAKTALIRMTEGLAQSAGPKGVAAFAIHPGIVKTRLLDSYGLTIPESMFAPPERAGDLCVRLASGRYDALSGRFLTITDDLDALVARADELAAHEQLLLRITASPM
jgi:NAD(P)-dependent dehydrogenase (short-subunit alcohol dehydrogenase family)